MSPWLRELSWNLGGYAALTGIALIVLLGLYLTFPSLRRRWLPLPRLRPGTWTGHEVFLAFCIFYGFQDLIPAGLLQIGFFSPLIGPMPGTDTSEAMRTLYLRRCQLISSPLSLTVILAVLLAVLYARSGSRPQHYGLTWGRWPANVGLGLLAYILATPLVMGLFLLTMLVFTPQPHLFQVLGQQGLEPWEWGLIAFQAIVTAPILEETLLRGILQGWLRRATLRGHVTLLFMTLLVPSLNLVKYDTEAEAPVYNADGVFALLFASLLASVYAFYLYRLTKNFALSEAEIVRWRPESITLAEAKEAARNRSWEESNAALALFGSAMLFAVIHPSWPTPIPLFCMGLVLGWMRGRTQSLIGPITYHAFFNLTSFIALYGISTSEPAQNGKAQTTPVNPPAVSAVSSVPGSQFPRRK